MKTKKNVFYLILGLYAKIEDRINQKKRYDALMDRLMGELKVLREEMAKTEAGEEEPLIITGTYTSDIPEEKSECKEEDKNMKRGELVYSNDSKAVIIKDTSLCDMCHGPRPECIEGCKLLY
ncbi:MAG: hypothetical protein IKG47_03600 [Oscillospiraceae bacterium]|nr:hypothetical protein [Oscillospiraceae bacterium]